ncbi:MAG TPA: MFS transporter [Anaeromyxobacteraceae bacterium]
MARDRDDADISWLLQFCAARVAFATMFTAYAAALPLLRRDWGMTAGRAGLVQSAYHLGFLVSLFAVGFLSDRHGARRTYLVTSVAAAASALLFAFLARGFLSGLLLYGLTGLCSGGSYTPGLAIVSERFARGGQGRAMGLYLAAASLGYAVALLLASALIPVAGWRGSFAAAALGPVLGAGLGFWTLRHTPNVVHPPADGGEVRGGLREVLRNRPAMLSVWGYTFHAWELLGMWAWLPAFLAAAAAAGGDMSLQAAGRGATFSALTYLVAVVGSAAGGSLSDRWGRTAVILAASVASLCISLSIGWMLGLPLWLVVTAAVLHNCTGVADSSVHSTALSELVPPRYLGAAYSLRSAVGFGAGALAPWVFGLVLDWGRGPLLGSERAAWGLAWASLGLGALLGPVATLRLRALPEARRLAGGRR